MKKLAIISLSGGLDSSTLLAHALASGKDVFTVGFKYGQANFPELQARKEIIEHFSKLYPENYIGDVVFNLEETMNIFTSTFQMLRDSNKIKEESNHKFYTPSRNLLFGVMSTVLGETIALAKDYEKIYIGLGIHKHSEEAYGAHKDYWDITPKFAKRFKKLLKLNDVKKVKVYTPFVKYTKTEVVQRALELEVPIDKTWTCYSPVFNEDLTYSACNECEACIERNLAIENAKRDSIK